MFDNLFVFAAFMLVVSMLAWVVSGKYRIDRRYFSLGMFGTAIRVFVNSWLQPVINPEFARTDAVKLAPGTYAAGLVLGNSNFGATATNAVQTITTTGTPTGGSFMLAWSMDQQYITTAIAYNSSAAAMQTILEVIFGVGNVVCTGGALPTGVVITFQGKCAATRMPAATIYANNLTGGSSPTPVVTNTTKGKAAGGEWIAYNDSGSEGEDTARMILKYPVKVDFMGVHRTGGFQHVNQWSAPAYYRGYFRTADLTGLDANSIADLGKIVRGNSSSLSNAGTILRVA